MALIFSAPPLSTFLSHLLMFSFAFCYVGSIYISKNARLSFSGAKAVPQVNGAPRTKENNERWRDDPDVIRARLTAVSVATLVCCAGVFGVLWNLSGGDQANPATAFEATLVRLGITSVSAWQSPMSHLVSPLLFLGPLYARFLAGSLPFQSQWRYNRDLAPIFTSWQGIRNFIVAPITEEIVFRACVLSVYHLSGASRTRMIFFGPLSFGLAHVHHAWDIYNRFGRTSAAAKRAVITTFIQLIYTTLFGLYCSYLFLRTGSVLPPISAHIFCNIMGLPQPAWEMSKFPNRKAAIIIAYISGILGFAFSLGPWTWNEGSFYWSDDLKKDIY